jgi:hypothetical protein
MFSRFVCSRFVAVVSMILFFATQLPHAYSQNIAPAPAVPTNNVTQTVASAQARSLTLQAGTSIPLTLINPVRSKSSKPGDAVRATVAFPVTAGTQVAIPAGTYAQGTIEAINPRAGSNGQPQLKIHIHFTQLLFANGYSVPLDAESTQAELAPPALAAPQSESAMISEPEPSEPDEVPTATPQAHLVRTSYMMGQQQQPSLPPLPSNGPSPGVVAGIFVGATAGILAAIILAAHHRAANLDYVLFDSGWQFQIVLDQPLTIDASRIATLAASPAGN